MTIIKVILWILQAVNVGAFIFMQWRAGHFSHKSYIAFATCSMLGAGATAVEGAIAHAWGTALTQGFFSVFFIFGITKRYLEMRSERRVQLAIK